MVSKKTTAASEQESTKKTTSTAKKSSAASKTATAAKSSAADTAVTSKKTTKTEKSSKAKASSKDQKAVKDQKTTKAAKTSKAKASEPKKSQKVEKASKAAESPKEIQPKKEASSAKAEKTSKTTKTTKTTKIKFTKASEDKSKAKPAATKAKPAATKTKPAATKAEPAAPKAKSSASKSKAKPKPKAQPSKSEVLTELTDSLVKSSGRAKTLTEDDIQASLQDIDLNSDELGELYEKLRSKGVSVTSESDDIAIPSSFDHDLDDDFDDLDDERDELDDDEDSEAAYEAKAIKEALHSVPKAKASHPKRSSRARARRASDGTTPIFTGDPVRMYLKEIGKVDLLNAAEEVDLAMKIEAGTLATTQLELHEAGKGDFSRAELRRFMRVEQVGLDAKKQLISANLRLVVSIAKRYVGRGML